MGQTLTHGVYLPDEGERNCYNGLAANWSILDGAVGTVAEHTSQIAGKAPLVHTHTKSDVTDLFNSANEWTDLQFYTQSIKFKVNLTIGAAPSSELYGGFNFGNTGTNIGNITARVSNAGATYTRLYIGNKFANGALDPNGTWKYAELQVGLRANGDRFIYTDGLWRNSLTPYDSNVSIGDSTHKWKTLNGINPGALSIFNPSATQDPIDVPNTWITDGSAWNTLNVSNMGDGWICLTYKLCGTNDYILARFGGTSANTNPSMIFPATMLHDSKYYLYVLMPAAKAMSNIYLEIKLDSNAVLIKHSFIPAYGTV